MSRAAILLAQTRGAYLQDGRILQSRPARVQATALFRNSG